MKIGFFLTNSNEGFYNWNQIEKSLFLDAPSIQKGFGHKYIKRFPKKSGIGYNYIYPEDMFRPFKTLLEFFGVKEKKIKDDYEKEGIKKDYGVDQKTYAMHVLEFFTNKEKWNTIFANKAKRDQYKKPVNQNVLKLTNSIAEKKADEQIKTAKEDKERGTALLQKKNSMLNRSLMRKVWGIYSVEGQRVEALENKTAQKEPAENGVFNDSPKTERDNITKEKIKNDYLNRITSIDKKTGEKTFKYDDGRLIKIDKNNNVLYDSLFDQAEPELKATSRKEIEQTAKNVFDTVKNTSNPTFDNASKIIDDIAVKTNMNMVDAAKVKEEVSKLFDKEKEIDERSENVSSKEITKINNDFNDDIEKLKNGEINGNYIFNLGKPSEILVKTGFNPNKNIEMLGKQLEVKKNKHDFSYDDLKNLPQELQEPIAVFKYGDGNKAQNVVISLSKDEKNFVVGVHFDYQGKEIQSVRGLFNKDNHEWLNWITQGKAKYLNKNKLQELINQQRNNLADVEYLDLKPIENILQQNPAVNDLFLEDDYIEEMNRHNAMLGNKNAYKGGSDEELPTKGNKVSDETLDNIKKKSYQEYIESSKNATLENLKKKLDFWKDSVEDIKHKRPVDYTGDDGKPSDALLKMDKARTEGIYQAIQDMIAEKEESEQEKHQNRSDAMMGNQNAKKFGAAIDAMISDISSKLDSIRTSTIYSDKQKNALLRDTYSELTKPIVDIAIMNSADRDMAISTVKDIVELLRSKVPESEKELIRNDLNWENIINLRNSSGDVPFKSENNKKPEEYSKTNNAALSQTEKNILALALEYEKRQDPTMSLLWYAEKVRNKFPELVSKLDNWTEIENIKFGDIDVQEIKDYAESVDKEENESTNKVKKDFDDLVNVLTTGNRLELESKKAGPVILESGETGKSGFGLKHIIEQRYIKDGKSEDEIVALIHLILEAVRDGEITRENNRNLELSKNGIVAILRKEPNNKGFQWVLTGFNNTETDEVKKEATDAITTVIANNSYTPEFSSFRNQVGAVIASINNNTSNSDIVNTDTTNLSEAMKGNQNAYKGGSKEEDDKYSLEAVKQILQSKNKDDFIKMMNSQPELPGGGKYYVNRIAQNIIDTYGKDSKEFDDLLENIEPYNRTGDSFHLYAIKDGMLKKFEQIEKDGIAFSKRNSKESKEFFKDGKFEKIKGETFFITKPIPSPSEYYKMNFMTNEEISGHFKVLKDENGLYIKAHTNNKTYLPDTESEKTQNRSEAMMGNQNAAGKHNVKPQTDSEMKEEQKKEKEARKKAGLPNPGNNVGDRVSAIDDADTWNPNSENYRFKDTGYIAGSRKELASMFIMERAKRGERIDAHELDFDGLEENPRAAEKLITKSNIFGEVDWDGLREKGMSGSTAFLIDRIYASAGSKPDESNAQARKQYVIALNGLRDRFEDCKTVPEVIDTLKEIREEIRGEYVEIKEMPEYKRITERMKSLNELMRNKRDELMSLSQQGSKTYDVEKQKIVEKYIQKGKDEKLLRWNTRVSVYNIPKQYQEDFEKETKGLWDKAYGPWKKAVADFKAELISRGVKEEDFFTGKKNMAGKPIEVSWYDYYTLMPEAQEYGALDSELDAYIKKMKVAVSMKNPLLEAWKSLGKRFTDILYSDSFAQHKYDCTKGTYDNWEWLEKEVKVTEKKQGKEKKKFEFLVANEITRKGGRTFNITATADLKKAFNLREVQSGNWVLKDPASAEFHVRNAANAFADLADVTGISDDKISLNGRLAMAFGARGTGGRYGAASAHYEPVERVINLTKFRGGGCLGHEWFHAFDNMITSAMTGDNSKSDIYLTNLYHGMTDANKQLLMNYIELKDAALTYTNNYRREQLKHQLEKKGVDMFKVDGFKSTLQIKVQAAFDNLVKAMTTGTADLRMNLEYDGKDYKAMLYNFSDDMLKRYRERFNSYSGSKKPMQLVIVDAGSLDKAVEEINKRFEGFNDSKHLKSKKDWLKLTAAYYDRQPDGNKNGIPLRVSTGKKVSNFLAWANEMDMNENKSYHSTTHEMAARAFSAYLEDTLESMGRKNDYLAYCSDNKYYSSDYKPYPEGEERKRINECFKKLFEVIRSENAIQKSIDFEKAQTKDFSVWHTKDGDIEVQKDANGEWHPVSRTGKKNSRLNDATNNDTSTATTKVGIPVSPQNTSTQTTKNYTRLDKQKSQSAMKYLNKIKTDTIAPREFLIKLKESFGVINLQDSNYITRKTGNKDITLRLSNHNANGEYVRKNESEISIVISLSESKFKNPDKKDIIEYVYKPENLSKEVKDGIIQGLVNWIKTGVYSDSHADSINKSIICHESIDMPDIIFTRDGRLLFKIA